MTKTRKKSSLNYEKKCLSPIWKRNHNTNSTIKTPHFIKPREYQNTTHKQHFVKTFEEQENTIKFTPKHENYVKKKLNLMCGLPTCPNIHRERRHRHQQKAGVEIGKSGHFGGHSSSIRARERTEVVSPSVSFIWTARHHAITAVGTSSRGSRMGRRAANRAWMDGKDEAEDKGPRFSSPIFLFGFRLFLGV